MTNEPLTKKKRFGHDVTPIKVERIPPKYVQMDDGLWIRIFDVRSAYLWALEKLNFAKENSDEIAMKKGLDLITLSEVNRVLKEAFEVVADE